MLKAQKNYNSQTEDLPREKEEQRLYKRGIKSYIKQGYYSLNLIDILSFVVCQSSEIA